MAGASKKSSAKKPTAKKPVAAKKKAVAPKKKTATKKPLPKKTATKKALPKKVAAPKKKVAAPKKKVAAPKKKVAAPKKKTASVRREPPAPTPSERALATCAEQPSERGLSDEERTAMEKVSDTARRFVGADGTPAEIVGGIAAFLDDVRIGKRLEPKSHDIRLGLGVLWGEQLRAQVGWHWVHLTYPDGFASYALVPDDRAFACFPLNRVPDALRSIGTNTSAHVFESIRENSLPARKRNAYLVIG